ncbi:hypothetical protein ScPMuIL_008874 [Solemya velum]
MSFHKAKFGPTAIPTNQPPPPIQHTVLPKSVMLGGLARPPPPANTMGQSTLTSPPSFSASQQLIGGLPQKSVSANGGVPNHNMTISVSPPLAQKNGTSTVSTVSGAMSGQLISEPQSQTSSTNAMATTEQHNQQPQNGTTLPTEQNLANTKEKTPMCLINELARYNKISHQYTLVDEQGPAHKKTFYVKLKLGDTEEYSSNGPSIKKAQHLAAEEALQKTSFPHPPPKPPRAQYGRTNQDSRTNMTPTVELNALAMKRGEPASYKPLEARLHYEDFRGMYHQRNYNSYMKMPRIYYISLKVGPREFIGEGNTRQSARHNAAAKALRILRHLPVPNQDLKQEQKVEEKPPEDEDDKLKSEISLVHEIALKHNLPVGFEVIRESGPPHMKTFITRCVVGQMVTEAEGNSKKLSKKRAAELMLEKLKELPPLAVYIQKPKNKLQSNKKKNRNIIKVNPTYGAGINPISRLIQIQQAQKKKEPVYTLLAERGLPRRREFVMQVAVDDKSCTGVGPNKKLAKRHAAEAMLTLLGYSQPSPQPSKPSLKTSGVTPEASPGEKKVTFVEQSGDTGVVMNGKTGRQLMPGLLLLGDTKLHPGEIYFHKVISKQVGSIIQSTMRPEVQLRELANQLNIDTKVVEFSAKNNSSEHLCRLTLSGINPPQVLHGSGITAEASRDDAALGALKVLTDMGMMSMKPEPIGDGPQIKMKHEDLVTAPTMCGASIVPTGVKQK